MKEDESDVTQPKKNKPKQEKVWADAFKPGVNHGDPGATPHGFESPKELEDRAKWKKEWEAWRSKQDIKEDPEDLAAANKQMNPQHKWDHKQAFGYIGTFNSRKINKALFQNQGKPLEEIFNRPQDIATVKAMDHLIASNTTKEDAIYTRYMDGAELIAKNYGVSSETAQAMIDIANSGKASAGTLKNLAAVLSGKTTYSAAYSSSSANRTLNVFQKAPIMRLIKTPAGSNMYLTHNSVESEAIFGRGLQTKVTGLHLETINGHPHLVIEEEFAGYKKPKY